MPEFKKFSDFPRGTMYDILCDAYSYDDRNKSIWDSNWRESDTFFYDNPEIADKYGLVTCIDGEPIGFVTWDPRNSPEYVEIGHNGIREEYKRQGYGHMQLEEALRRIREYEGLKRIIVCTNSNLAAPKNYESVGFQLYDRKPNKTESAYTGDYLYYEIVLDMRRPSLMDDTKNRFMGISCAYQDPSDRIVTEYAGFADKESSIPVDENTVFPACSISKFVTALCAMKAREQKLINIDAPANNYLSRWKLRTPDGGESDASVRSLLCHTAGIIDGEDAFYGLRRNDSTIGLTDILEGKTPYNNRPARTEKAPGTDFEYSDAGYCVLQLLIEDITQKPFDEFAGECFFKALDLKRTFFASPDNVAHFEKEYVLATGYDENGMPIPGKYPQVPDLAASGLWSTPKELLTLAREFYKAYNGKSSMLQESSVREMAKPAEKFPWIGLGVFMGGENEIVSRGWGENGQSMLKINYVTGDIAVAMTNQNPGVDQAESGLEALVNRKRV